MKTKTIRQSVTFKTSPHEIYEALMDSRRHAKFTGTRAEISCKVGGEFTAYDGYIKGINLNPMPDKKIVQPWRGSDWPEGHYSRPTFSLRRRMAHGLRSHRAGSRARSIRTSDKDGVIIAGNR